MKIVTIGLTGPMASGKTQLARALSVALQDLKLTEEVRFDVFTRLTESDSFQGEASYLYEVPRAPVVITGIAPTVYPFDEPSTRRAAKMPYPPPKEAPVEHGPMLEDEDTILGRDRSFK